MTIDFPSPYPANTTAVGKPVDIQTLQEAFAVALRGYGTEKTGSFTNTILEVLRTPHMDGAINADRQQRREQQHIERNDFAKIDRKLLDKSETRSSEMNSDYRDRLERNETLRNDYRERTERSELQRSEVQPGISSPMPSMVLPLDIAKSNESVPNKEHLPLPKNVSEIVGTNSRSPSTNAPNSATNNGQVNVLMPWGNVPVSISNPVAPPVVPPQAFTIFTPSGRFGLTQGKSNEKEDDEEEPVEGKTTKKHQPFAVFEAIRTAQQNVSWQPKEPISNPVLQQITERSHEKPKEAEWDQSRVVKTLEEFLDTPVQSVSAPKKEKPNQTQYLNRIAAACEAASMFAPIRIKINLDHLGTLTLRFFYKADKLALRFETPSRESAQFLHNHLDGLRTILSKRNVKTASIEILQDPSS